MAMLRTLWRFGLTLLCSSPLASIIGEEVRFGVKIFASPRNYFAKCQGGTYLVSLPLLFAEKAAGNITCNATSSYCNAGGPYLYATGAGSAVCDGLYTLSADPSNATHQYYTKGEYTLLWEPGPREAFGLRWMIFGPEGLLYQKYTIDDLLGWRGTPTLGEWSVHLGQAPAPVVESDQPEDKLAVRSSGSSAANGLYTRVPGAGKMYARGSHFILWQPGPETLAGERWTLFSAAARTEVAARDGLATQYRTHYFRLSEDSEAGHEGTWAADWALYPPPKVSLVPTVACFRCEPGTFSTAGSKQCERCPPGFYSLGIADACTSCQPGTFANSGLGLVSEAPEPAAHSLGLNDGLHDSARPQAMSE
mmetsp:Transcript_122021/g.390155  ORF Transcript_122021/g.390155 Transcript_122021/m.390155 type:complete len:364 (+) Transcript_122021:80-1171(+)